MERIDITKSNLCGLVGDYHFLLSYLTYKNYTLILLTAALPHRTKSRIIYKSEMFHNIVAVSILLAVLVHFKISDCCWLFVVYTMGECRAVHRYPVPAPYRIPLRKIPVNTVSDFNGMLIGILQNNTTNGGTWL